MVSSFPSPPVLKTTIIQLNKELDSDDNNYEILTNEYLNGSLDGQSTPRDANNSNNTSNNNSISTNTLDIISSPSSSLSSSTNLPNKKKRRRSSANIDSEELAKRKHETKQLHSIIEKRRRIKINREFEALKYLIPACRNSTGGSSAPSTPNITAINSKKTPPPSSSNANNNNNNGNKIDGMYKLTILKSSVEYILYLHHIIQKQNELLLKVEEANNGSDQPYKNFNIDFAKIPLNVNQYRNIDKDFNFKDLLNDYENGTTISPTVNNTARRNYDFRTHVIKEEDEGEEDEDEELEDADTQDRVSQEGIQSTTEQGDNYSTTSKSQLPSPDITPNMAPILTLLNKYNNNNNSSISMSSSLSTESRKSSFPVSPNTIAFHSTNSSPYSNPLKSSFSAIPLSKASSTSPPVRIQRGIVPSSSGANANNRFALPDPAINPTSKLTELPKKKFFKSKIPNIVIFNGDESKAGLDDNDERLTDQDASKTLLALRKSSIDSLLN